MGWLDDALRRGGRAINDRAARLTAPPTGRWFDQSAEIVGRSVAGAPYTTGILKDLDDAAKAARAAAQVHLESIPKGGPGTPEFENWQAEQVQLQSAAAARESELMHAVQTATGRYEPQRPFMEGAIPESLESAVRGIFETPNQTLERQPAFRPGERAGAESRSEVVRRPVERAPLGGRATKAAEMARAARDARDPARVLADQIDAAIRNATPVRIGDTGGLETSWFGHMSDPEVRRLINDNDPALVDQALRHLAVDYDVNETDSLRHRVPAAIFKDIGASARAGSTNAGAIGPDVEARPSEVGDLELPIPGKSTLGGAAADVPTSSSRGPSPRMTFAEDDVDAIESGVPVREPLAPRVIVSARIDPITGKPQLDANGNPVPLVDPASLPRPGSPDWASVRRGDLNILGLKRQQDVGLFLGRQVTDANGNVTVEADYDKPLIELVKARTGGDGNRSAEDRIWLSPLRRGGYQVVTIDPNTGGPGAPAVANDADVNRLLKEGYVSSGRIGGVGNRLAGKDPSYVGRSILETIKEGASPESLRAMAGELQQWRLLGTEKDIRAIEEAAGVGDVALGRQRIQQIADAGASAAEDPGMLTPAPAGLSREILGGMNRNLDQSRAERLRGRADDQLARQGIVAPYGGTLRKDKIPELVAESASAQLPLRVRWTSNPQDPENIRTTESLEVNPTPSSSVLAGIAPRNMPGVSSVDAAASGATAVRGPGGQFIRRPAGAQTVSGGGPTDVRDVSGSTAVDPSIIDDWKSPLGYTETADTQSINPGILDELFSRPNYGAMLGTPQMSFMLSPDSPLHGFVLGDTPAASLARSRQAGDFDVYPYSQAEVDAVNYSPATKDLLQPPGADVPGTVAPGGPIEVSQGAFSPVEFISDVTNVASPADARFNSFVERNTPDAPGQGVVDANAGPMPTPEQIRVIRKGARSAALADRVLAGRERMIARKEFGRPQERAQLVAGKPVPVLEDPVLRATRDAVEQRQQATLSELMPYLPKGTAPKPLDFDTLRTLYKDAFAGQGGARLKYPIGIGHAEQRMDGDRIGGTRPEAYRAAGAERKRLDSELDAIDEEISRAGPGDDLNALEDRRAAKLREIETADEDMDSIATSFAADKDVSLDTSGTSLSNLIDRFMGGKTPSERMDALRQLVSTDYVNPSEMFAGMRRAAQARGLEPPSDEDIIYSVIMRDPRVGNGLSADAVRAAAEKAAADLRFAYDVPKPAPEAKVGPVDETPTRIQQLAAFLKRTFLPPLRDMFPRKPEIEQPDPLDRLHQLLPQQDINTLTPQSYTTAVDGGAGQAQASRLAEIGSRIESLERDIEARVRAEAPEDVANAANRFKGYDLEQRIRTAQLESPELRSLRAEYASGSEALRRQVAETALSRVERAAREIPVGIYRTEEVAPLRAAIEQSRRNVLSVLNPSGATTTPRMQTQAQKQWADIKGKMAALDQEARFGTEDTSEKMSDLLDARDRLAGDLPAASPEAQAYREIVESEAPKQSEAAIASEEADTFPRTIRRVDEILREMAPLQRELDKINAQYEPQVLPSGRVLDPARGVGFGGPGLPKDKKVRGRWRPQEPRSSSSSVDDYRQELNGRLNELKAELSAAGHEFSDSDLHAYLPERAAAGSRGPAIPASSLDFGVLLRGEDADLLRQLSADPTSVMESRRVAAIEAQRKADRDAGKPVDETEIEPAYRWATGPLVFEVRDLNDGRAEIAVRRRYGDSTEPEHTFIGDIANPGDARPGHETVTFANKSGQVQPVLTPFQVPTRASDDVSFDGPPVIGGQQSSFDADDLARAGEDAAMLGTERAGTMGASSEIDGSIRRPLDGLDAESRPARAASPEETVLADPPKTRDGSRVVEILNRPKVIEDPARPKPAGASSPEPKKDPKSLSRRAGEATRKGFDVATSKGARRTGAAGLMALLAYRMAGNNGLLEGDQLLAAEPGLGGIGVGGEGLGDTNSEADGLADRVRQARRTPYFVAGNVLPR